MPEDAESVLKIFATQQLRLSDLLSITHRPYIAASSGEGDPTGPIVEPNVRASKVAATVLPHNPYFKENAEQARHVLGLSERGLERSGIDGFRKSVELGVTMTTDIIPYVWSAWWLAIHSVKFAMSPPPAISGLPLFLPQWLRSYAEQGHGLHISEDAWPEWTLLRPRYPASERGRAHTPLDKITGMFLSAYDLPSRLFDYVRWYILTDDEGFLVRASSPLEVEIDAPIGQDGKPHIDVVVRGIDTSTIKADWQEIWDQELAPLLDKWFVGEIQTDRLLSDQPLLIDEELDKALRRGRRQHQAGLKVADYASFFEFWNQRDAGDLNAAIDDYLNDHPEDKALKFGGVELRTVKANIIRLQGIMMPR